MGLVAHGHGGVRGSRGDSSLPRRLVGRLRGVWGGGRGGAQPRQRRHLLRATLKGRPIGSGGEVQLRYAAVTEWVGGMVVRDTNYTDIDEARAAAERLAEE